MPNKLIFGTDDTSTLMKIANTIDTIVTDNDPVNIIMKKTNLGYDDARELFYIIKGIQ